MTKVKRNHHLPRFYLNAWADPKGQVALRRRGEKQGILTSVGNVGVVNGLHNPRAESLLGRTETAAAPVIKSLLADTDALGRWKNRRVLARFMAELMARQPYMATFRGLSPKTYENILDVSEDARAILRILRGEYGPNIQFEDAKGIQGDIKEIQDGVSKRWPDITEKKPKRKCANWRRTLKPLNNSAPWSSNIQKALRCLNVSGASGLHRAGLYANPLE